MDGPLVELGAVVVAGDRRRARRDAAAAANSRGIDAFGGVMLSDDRVDQSRITRRLVE